MLLVSQKKSWTGFEQWTVVSSARSHLFLAQDSTFLQSSTSFPRCSFVLTLPSLRRQTPSLSTDILINGSGGTNTCSKILLTLGYCTLLAEKCTVFLRRNSRIILTHTFN